MKFGQLIEYNKRNIFLQKNNSRNEAGRIITGHFLFFKKALYMIKAKCLQLGFTIFRQPSNQHTIKTRIYSILTFQKRVGKQFVHHIWCMIFEQKCFSCYILLNDQISLSDYFYLQRYWAICALQFFVSQVCDVKNFEINFVFLMKPFLYMTKK